MSTKESQDDLFIRYLNICNQAIEANKDRFPYSQILAAATAPESSRSVEVCIIEDHPEAKYVIQVEDSKLSGKPHESCEKCDCQGQWRVTRSYLEDVIKNPDEYIQNPAKIDWEWMHNSDKP